MYSYESEKVGLFSEKGSVMFNEIRDNVRELLKKSGAFKMSYSFIGVSGNGWALMACVDRMVELKEIYEVTGSEYAGQDRTFIAIGKFKEDL